MRSSPWIQYPYYKKRLWEKAAINVRLFYDFFTVKRKAD